MNLSAYYYAALQVGSVLLWSVHLIFICHIFGLLSSTNVGIVGGMLFQVFYGPFSGTTRVSQCQKRTSGLYGARED